MKDLSQERLDIVLSTPFQYFDSVDSTNDIAKEWLQDGAKSGSVVIADEQLKGRGRKGRFWHTPPDSALAVSIILRPPIDFLNRISMIGALSVYDLCSEIGTSDVGIKWPNDVQISGKKVSGILPEALWDNDNLQGVILGIGINVRVTFVEELKNIATNLETTTNQPLDRAELIGILMKRIMYWMDNVSTELLFDTWQSRLNTIGKLVSVNDTVGQAVGVDTSGALLIKIADGSIKKVMAGDVHLV